MQEAYFSDSEVSMVLKRILFVLSALVLAFSVNVFANSSSTTGLAQLPAAVKVGDNWVYVHNMTGWQVNVSLYGDSRRDYTIYPYGQSGAEGYLDLGYSTYGRLYAYTNDGVIIFDQIVNAGSGWEFYSPYGDAANGKKVHPKVRQIQP